MRNFTAYLFVGICFSAFAVFTACQNPVGLGPRVNTEKPVINVEGENTPGSFLSGDGKNGRNRIELEIDQPFGLDSVYVYISYIDPVTGEEVTHGDPIRAVQNKDGLWYVDLDVENIPDGQINVWAIATDISGNSSKTTPMIYIVKNLPPQIEMTIPTVRGRDFDSIDFDLNDHLTTNDPIFVGFDLMGLATDNLGIELGYPKIMIWPISEDNGFGEPVPGSRWAHWRSTVINGARRGMTTTRFNWPMKELIADQSDPTGWRIPGLNDPHRMLLPGNYRFRIWIKDTEGRDNFYPHRSDNERGPDGKPETPNTLEQKFMEIRYVNQSLPIVTYMSVPPYFNGEGYISENNEYVAGSYRIYITVTSVEDVLPGNVKGWITDADESFKSPEYDFAFVPTEQNPHRWRLDISAEQAAAWFTQYPAPLVDAEGNPREEVTLFVKARATNINSDSSPPDPGRNFNFDRKPPGVIMDRPITVPTAFAAGNVKGGRYEIFYPLYDVLNPMPRWVTGLVTIGGSNLDGFGLSRIYYHIGNLGDDAPHGITRESIYNAAHWVDTELHRTGRTDEYGGVWTGSLYAWNYQNNFNEWGRHKNCGSTCSDPVLHARIKDLIQESRDLVNIDGVNYTTEGKTRFYLPFYIKVVDTAGNFHIVQYKLCIDPDLDIPYVSVSTPVPDNSGNTIIGGEVSLSGLATDNDWIYSVQIRIRKYGTAAQLQHPNLHGALRTDPSITDSARPNTYRYYRPYRHNTANEPSNLIPFVYDVNPAFPLPAGDPNTEDSKAGWFNAEKRNNDSVIGWFFNINTWGGLDPEGDLKMVNVRIEVRAVDSKDRGATTTNSVVGASTTMDVQFSSGVPTITQTVIRKTGVHDRSYYEGITASGRFEVSMEVSDDENLMNIRTSINGRRFDLLTNYIVLNNTVNQTAGLSITIPARNDAGRMASNLKIDVNTLSGGDLYSDLGYGRTGTITLEVEVHDNSTPTYITRTRFIIGVDNYYPTTSLETAVNASGTQFELSGLASDTGPDSGTLQDIARVLVYFEELTVSAEGAFTRTGIYRNPRGFRNGSVAGGGFSAQTGEVDARYSAAIYKSADNSAVSGNWDSASLVMESYPNVRPDGSTATTWGTNFVNFPVLREINRGSSAGKVWESPHAMVIDNHELAEDHDEDGTLGEAWSGLVEKTWRAWMNTELFKDGPYMVHYIVMDGAGNATHSMKDIFIENNKPEIVFINLGTNISGSANSRAWSSTDSGDFMRVRYSIEQTGSGNRIVTFTDIVDNPFRVRGSRLSLLLETRKGNGAKHYRVSYVTPGQTIGAGSMVRGQVYTIVQSGTTDWQRYGAVNNSIHTTFVASGPGSGSGRVLAYTEVRSSQARQITGNNGNDMLNETVFTAADFGAAAGQIPDSEKTGTGDILRPLPGRPANWPGDWDLHWPERLFIIKVYDTTVPGRGEEHQLAHAVLVALDIDNNDSKAPVINPAGFGQKYRIRPSVTGESRAPNIDNDADRILASVDSYEENIVMSAATPPVKQGYVQYAEHTIGGTAQISGQVIFTGKASDNQRIQNITVAIDGYDGGAGAGSPFTVAAWNTGTGMLTSSRTAMGSNANQMWYFRITDHSLSLDYGHVVNWEFVWDSSYVANQVGNPAGGVVFRVNDFRTGTPTAGSGSLNVNIVPYISEITTGLSGAYDPPSAFARSANGWYPVNETETITISGFNLGGGNSAATAVTLNDTGITASNITRTSIRAAIGTAAGSGNVVVRVNNAVNSINNSTTKNAFFCTVAGCTAAVKSSLSAGNCTGGGHASAARTQNRVAYNWEPNGVNNNNLTNDRKLYVWNTGYVLNDTTIVNPFMRLDSAGNRYLAAGRYVSNGGTGGSTSEGHLKVFRNNNGVSATGGVGGTNRPGVTPTAAAPTNNSTTANTALFQTNRFLHTTIAVAGGVNSVTGGEEWAVAASNLTSGQSNFHLVYHSLLANDANAAGGNGNRRMRNLGVDYDKIQIPRLALQRTSDTAAGAGMFTRPVRMVLSYYDAVAQSLVLHYGTHNGNATWSAAFLNDNATAPHDAATYQIANSGTTVKGGIYHSVGLTTDGRPVLAWYDQHSSPTGLYFSYGDAGATATVANWRSRAVLIGNGVGTHVDLAVDAGNNIHIAYVDANNGGLYYTYIPATSASNSVPLVANRVTNRVDTFLSTGQKLMINVRTDATGVYRPYISYIHNAFAETRNSIRVAWLKDVSVAGRTNGTTGNFFTGAWEVMTVPAESIPLTSEFICNGVPNNTNAAFVQPTASTLRGDSSIGNTMFVGYMTQRWYEGAILKANIRTLQY